MIYRTSFILYHFFYQRVRLLVNLNQSIYQTPLDSNKDITPAASEKVIVKHYPNSFLATELQAALQEKAVTELVICGMMTHMCIDTTVRAAKDLGYHISLISDACTTRDLDWNGTKFPASVVQNVYMASLNQNFANVTTCTEYFRYPQVIPVNPVYAAPVNTASPSHKVFEKQAPM